MQKMTDQELKCRNMAKQYQKLLTADLKTNKTQQRKVLNFAHDWAEQCAMASRVITSERYWLQLKVASARDLITSGEALECTKWSSIGPSFKEALTQSHFQALERVIHDGFEVLTLTSRERVRGRLHKSAKDRIQEIFAIIWTDVGRFQSLLYPPKTLHLLKAANVECCAFGRVEKHSTATGLPKGVGRLIHDLSFAASLFGELRASTNERLIPDSYPKYVCPRHVDFVRASAVLEAFNSKVSQKCNKYDVSQAFRRLAIALWSVGDLAGEIEGHTVVELCGVFGLGSMPAIYHLFGTLLISKAHNSKWMVFPNKLVDINWDELDPETELEILSLEDVISRNLIGHGVPLFSETFVDDTVKVMLNHPACIKACDKVASECVRSRFGFDGLSLKDVDEMKAEDQQTVIGQLMDFRKKLIRPTPARIQKGIRILRDVQVYAQVELLTARQAYQVYCLWLWICIGEQRLRPFVHTLKRPLEGFTNDISPDAQVWSDKSSDCWLEYNSCLSVLIAWGEEQLAGLMEWKTTFWQMLSPQDKIESPGADVWLQCIQKDSSMCALGAINFTRQEYFYMVLPDWAIQEMQKTFSEGFAAGDTDQFTIGLGEHVARTLVQWVWSGTSHVVGTDISVLERSSEGSAVSITEEIELHRDGHPSALWIQEDNAGVEAHGNRGWAPSSTGQRQLRYEADHALRTKGVSFTTRVPKKENISDLPSRLFKLSEDKELVFDESAAAELIDTVESLDHNLSEVLVPQCWLNLACERSDYPDVLTELRHARDVISNNRVKVISWADSKSKLLQHFTGVGRATPNWDKSTGVTAAQANFLELTPSSGLGTLNRAPKIAFWAFRSQNSMRGFLHEDFECVELSDIASWAVAEGLRKFPEAIQLGNLELATPDQGAEVIDCVDIGAPCQPFSGLGNVAGSEHKSSGVYIAAVKLAIKRQAKTIHLEQVLTILVYAEGFYQKLALHLLHAAGYSTTMRASNTYEHGVPAARWRLITIATLDRYGPHELLGGLESMRRPSDPVCVADIALPHNEARKRGAKFYSPASVVYSTATLERLGEVRTIGQIGKGGPGWPGGADRTVRDANGPAGPISTSGNSGVYEFTERNGMKVVRELCTVENAILQGMLTDELGELLNSTDPTVTLSDREHIAREAIGIGEVPQETQSRARAVKRFLQHRPHLPNVRDLPQVKQATLQDFNFGQQLVPGYTERLLTVAEIQTLERNKIKTTQQSEVKPFDWLNFKANPHFVGGDEADATESYRMHLKKHRPAKESVEHRPEEMHCFGCCSSYPKTWMCVVCMECMDCCAVDCKKQMSHKPAQFETELSELTESWLAEEQDVAESPELILVSTGATNTTVEEPPHMSFCWEEPSLVSKPAEMWEVTVEENNSVSDNPSPVDSVQPSSRVNARRKSRQLCSSSEDSDSPPREEGSLLRSPMNTSVSNMHSRQMSHRPVLHLGPVTSEPTEEGHQTHINQIDMQRPGAESQRCYKLPRGLADVDIQRSVEFFGDEEKLANRAVRPAFEKIASDLNQMFGSFNWTTELACNSFIASKKQFHKDLLPSGSWDPAVRDMRRARGNKPAGLCTPELKLTLPHEMDAVVADWGVLQILLQVELPVQLQEDIVLATRRKSLCVLRFELEKLLNVQRALDNMTYHLHNCHRTSEHLALKEYVVLWNKKIQNWTCEDKTVSQALGDDDYQGDDTSEPKGIELLKLPLTDPISCSFCMEQSTTYCAHCGLCKECCPENDCRCTICGFPLEYCASCKTNGCENRCESTSDAETYKHSVTCEEHRGDSKFRVVLDGPDPTGPQLNVTSVSRGHLTWKKTVSKMRKADLKRLHRCIALYHPKLANVEEGMSWEMVRNQCLELCIHVDSLELADLLEETFYVYECVGGRHERHRFILKPDDPTLVGYLDELKALSLEVSSHAAYSGHWEKFVQFCNDTGLDYELSGKNPKQDEQTLQLYVAFEYGYHRNAYSTVNGKLYAIRWYTMDAGFKNPLEDKFKLDRMMRGLKKVRGGVNRKIPVTPEHLECAVRYLMGESGYLALGLRTALQLGFFYLLRISEFAAVDEKSKAKWILRRCDVSFFRKGVACGPSESAVKAWRLDNVLSG